MPLGQTHVGVEVQGGQPVLTRHLLIMIDGGGRDAVVSARLFDAVADPFSLREGRRRRLDRIAFAVAVQVDVQPAVGKPVGGR